MHHRAGSNGLRWFAVGLLAVAFAPILLAWRSAAREASAVSPDLNAWAGAPWTDPARIGVEMRSGTDDSALAEIGRRVGAPLIWDGPDGEAEGIAVMTLSAGISSANALVALRQDPRVVADDVIHLYRSPETLAGTAPDRQPSAGAPDDGRWRPNDPRYGEQWNFRMVDAEGAWEVTRGKGVIVAVIDTGVAYADTRKGSRARDFGGTRFVAGYDFCAKDAVPYDDNGHGTHVAGTIAETTDNGEGVAGLAFDASIMPLKVLTAEGYGSSADIAEAIRWAADHGASVINMSLGGPFPDNLMRDACAYARKKGAVIVCAAGNSGREGVGYPAAFADCIAVSAVGPERKLSFYSSWGKQIAVSAPGGDKTVDPNNGGILQNTVLRDENGALQDDYFAFQGTSMATPHVAAVAAMIVSSGVRDPADVRFVLQKSAQRVDGPSSKYGAGIVSASGAAKLAANLYGDAVTRFWAVVLLFACCYGIGRVRAASGSSEGAPFWGTAALSLGLLLPDWLTGYFGMSAHANLLGHSVLVPALLALGLDARDSTERRLVGWMAVGMALHLGWEFLRGTAPFGPEIGAWSLLLWIAANLIVGTGLFFAGIAATKK